MILIVAFRDFQSPHNKMSEKLSVSRIFHYGATTVSQTLPHKQPSSLVIYISFLLQLNSPYFITQPQISHLHLLSSFAPCKNISRLTTGVFATNTCNLFWNIFFSSDFTKKVGCPKFVSVNFLNNGVEINLTRLSEFLSSKKTRRIILNVPVH